MRGAAYTIPRWIPPARTMRAIRAVLDVFDTRRVTVCLLSSSKRLRPTALMWYNLHVSTRLTVPSKGVSRAGQRLRPRLLS